MEVSMSKTRRGKYTDNCICYISKCKGGMRLYLRRKGKHPCFSYLVRGKSFSFYRGKIQIKSETRHKLSFFLTLLMIMYQKTAKCVWWIVLFAVWTSTLSWISTGKDMESNPSASPQTQDTDQRRTMSTWRWKRWWDM